MSNPTLATGPIRAHLRAHPVQAVKSAATEPHSAPTVRAGMHATVLVVDDEKNILLTLQQSLQLEGYRIELAASGQLALEVLSARPIDAVLMDVKMPDLDG